MDEILATIRRIIAEDERSSSAGTRGAPAGVAPVAVSSPGASPVGVSPLGVSKERAEGPREAAQASAEPAGANDVLDLTDALDEDGGARRRRAAPRCLRRPDAPVHAQPPVETEAAEPITAEPKPAEANLRTDRPPPAEASPESDRAADPGPAAPPPAEPPPGATTSGLSRMSPRWPPRRRSGVWPPLRGFGGSRRWSGAARSTRSSATCCARCCRPGSTRTCPASSSVSSRRKSPGFRPAPDRVEPAVGRLRRGPAAHWQSAICDRTISGVSNATT